MSTKYVAIGIDPGKNGGIAALGPTGTVVTVETMPTTDADVLAVLRALAYTATGGSPIDPTTVPTSCHAFLEHVRSSPQMGVVSAFTFGRGYGALCMALQASHIPYTEVVPRVWQQALGCLTRGDKNISKRRAQALFPQLKVTHATADALLLAEYGRRALHWDAARNGTERERR